MASPAFLGMQTVEDQAPTSADTVLSRAIVQSNQGVPMLQIGTQVGIDEWVSICVARLPQAKASSFCNRQTKRVVSCSILFY